MPRKGRQRFVDAHQLRDYIGGKWWRKVDVSRFQEIQRIVDDYPDSPYAEWIRFGKLYHYGPTEEAIQYAREHRDFPLSDNLMLRMAEGLYQEAEKQDQAASNGARELAREIIRDFPDGDARPGVYTCISEPCGLSVETPVLTICPGGTANLEFETTNNSGCLRYIY